MDDTPTVLAGYKRTEIGPIPSSWEVKSFGVLATLRTGPFGSALHKADYIDGGTPLINPMHIVDGQLLPEEGTSVSDHAAHRLAAYRLIPGDIVIGRRGEIGRCAVVRRSQAGWLCGTGSLIIRCHEYVDAEFVQRILTTKRVIGAIESASVGSTMINLNQAALSGLQIQCPPLPEQRAIAEALSDVDGLLGALEALIAKKRAIKQAAMQQLLTGKTRLPGFSGEWERKKIRDIAKIPVTDGPHLTPKFLSQGIPFLSVNNLVNNRVDATDLRYVSLDDHREFSKKCKPQMGDVLLGKAASVGKVAIVDFIWEFNIWSPIALIRIDRPNVPHFVYYALQGPAAVKQINYFTNSSSQGNVGMGDIEKLELSLPPSDEQQAIATVLSDMDAEIATLERHHDKTRAIKQGMMQQLLTGRVRLVNQRSSANA